MKVCINCQGHMTKTAAMAINSKNLQKIFFRTRRPMILKLGIMRQGIELNKVYINHGPEMILTYITARSTKVGHAFKWEKWFKCHLNVTARGIKMYIK